MRLLARLSFLVLLLALVSLAGFYFAQRALIFPAPAGAEPVSLPDDVSRVDLQAGYGLLMLPASKNRGPHPLVIYTHGNAELARWSVPVFRPWQQAGYAVMLIEYPGYGGADGQASYESIESTVVSAYDKLTARADIDARAVIAYGRSIGGGGAGILASRREVAALILESTFTSLPGLIAEKWFPEFLVRDRFDTEAVVRSIDAPVFVYHGSRDQVIPVHHGESLARAAKSGKLVLAECGHNDCVRPGQAAIDFLKARGLGPAS